MLDSMSSGGRADTRTAILEAARVLFEEQGYFGSALEGVATKADLLTELHRYIYETDVVPALEHHQLPTSATALVALDAAIAVDAEVASKVWKIHEALVVARRHHPEVEETLRPREEERYQEY